MILAFAMALQPPAFGQGGPRGNQNCCLPSPAQPATAEEGKWLAFMREEEKLARDVYRELNAKWNLRIFSNIAASEERHFESVKVLLDRYGVQDPAANTAPGVFADQRLAALYTQLIAKGLTSLKDALEAGVQIEKTDIEDLENALKATVKTDIKTVYTNLLNGSLNHQEAFEANLEIVAANR
ncbi:MAG: DUF2202 domain-containing protein [Bryobacteraceae bacterium]